MLAINVVGRFCVSDLGGGDVTPRSRKACGLLALLALAPRKSRTRTWLQDKLWSDRGAEQAAGSLRQCLTGIRNAFGSERDALLTDNISVGLDPSLVSVDIDNLPKTLSRVGGRPELLEGLDVRDQEFEDWLRVARQAFEDRVVAQEGAELQASVPEALLRPRLILEADADCPMADQSLARFMAHRIAQGVADAASVRVQPSQHATHGGGQSASVEGLRVVTAALRVGHDTALRVSLFSEDGREVLWSVTQTIPELADHVVDHPTAQQIYNQSVDAAAEFLRSRGRLDAAKPVATRLGLEAVQKIFTLRQADLEEADQLLRTAQELDPRGIYPAWRGFLRTIFVGERRPVDRGDVRLECEEFTREALAREPHNSNVYALAAHVNYLVMDNSEAAMMLAETSLALNPGNPLAHAHFGTASADAGRCEEGYSHAIKALAIAGTGSYRYQIMNHCCVTAILTGRYHEAIYHGECARALAPDFLPPMRSLAALYFHSGNFRKVERLLGDLRRHEPDFTLDMLRDDSYPAATLRRTPLIQLADAREFMT